MYNIVRGRPQKSAEASGMLNAREIMIRDVYTVHRGDSVKSVLEKFVQYRISGMPIVDDDRRLVGYISDGDIMRYLGRHFDDPMTSWVSAVGFYYGMPADARDLDKIDELRENALAVSKKTAEQVGNRRVVTVEEDDSLVDVAEVLARRKIKKVPVIKNGYLQGIISRGDVVRAVVQKVMNEVK